MNPKYGVYADESGWLIDTCVGLTWSWDVNEACWFDSPDEAIGSLKAADCTAALAKIQILRLK